jgi:AraC-like DNA-binding protein
MASAQLAMAGQADTGERFESARRRAIAPLRPFVAWYTGYRQTGGSPGRHRGLPSPYVTFIVTLDEPCEVAVPSNPREAPRAYGTLIGGLHKTPTIIAHPGRQSGIQLAVEPLGVRALLGLPASELANIDVSASDVLGPLADELHERVREARSWTDRFAIFDEVLLRRLSRDLHAPAALEVSHAWASLKQSHGQLDVADVADCVGWSSRHLAERFAGEIGLSPKAAARVIRFDRARRQLQKRAAQGVLGSLATLAADFGYYDQAHLALEFRQLAGCSPSQWLGEELRNFQGLALDDSAEFEL